jgi:SAM-dependent methyltransferase
VLRLAGRLKGKVALDLGAPDGSLVRLLTERGARASGVEHLDRPSTLPRGPFDLVTALRVFDPVAKPVKLLRVLARLLRPGGRLVLAFAHPYDEPPDARPLESLFGSLRDVGLRVADLSEPHTDDDPPRRFLVLLCERRSRRPKNRGTRRSR